MLVASDSSGDSRSHPFGRRRDSFFDFDSESLIAGAVDEFKRAMPATLSRPRIA